MLKPRSASRDVSRSARSLGSSGKFVMAYFFMNKSDLRDFGLVRESTIDKPEGFTISTPIAFIVRCSTSQRLILPAPFGSCSPTARNYMRKLSIIPSLYSATLFGTMITQERFWYLELGLCGNPSYRTYLLVDNGSDRPTDSNWQKHGSSYTPLPV